jgi:hypothetical protein
LLHFQSPLIEFWRGNLGSWLRREPRAATSANPFWLQGLLGLQLYGRKASPKTIMLRMDFSHNEQGANSKVQKSEAERVGSAASGIGIEPGVKPFPEDGRQP